MDKEDEIDWDWNGNPIEWTTGKIGWPIIGYYTNDSQAEVQVADISKEAAKNNPWYRKYAKLKKS